MYIKVKVTPESPNESLTQVSSDHFEARVREPAEMNMANKQIVRMVARHYDLPTAKVRIISGHRSRSKILDVNIDKK